MSYTAREISPHAGAPLELYRFVQGTTRFLYTSAGEPVTYLSETYQPIPIARSAPEQSQERALSGITVTVPRDNPVAGLYRQIVPATPVGLTLYRLHRDAPDTDAIAFWSGRIRSVAWRGAVADIDCEPFNGLLKREGLRLHYQATCNHVLYGPACQANAAAFKTTGQVVTLDALRVEIPALSAEPDGYYTAGYLARNEADWRMIVQHQGSWATLLLPFPDLEVNETLDLYPGCNRLMSDCQGKFNNLANFGGFPYIPTQNPFQSGLE